MSALTFNILGPFEATDSYGQRLQFPTTKTKALLAYLLFEESRRPGITHQRGHLMMLLWPDVLPKSAQTNLRQSLCRLRRTLPEFEISPGHLEPLLLSDRQGVQVNPLVDYRLDVAEFHRAVGQAEREPQQGQMAASLSEAAALYRGDFLEDVYVPDSEVFENWAEQVREDLRRKALDALYRIGDYALASGDYSRAQNMARRQIAIDDLHEAAYRQLMVALSADGQRNEALTEFDRLTQLLADELGIEPAQESAELAEAIRQGENAPEPDRHVIPNTTPVEPQAELTLLDKIQVDDTASYKYFTTTNELRELVADDQSLRLSNRFGHPSAEKQSIDRRAAGPPSNLPYELNRFVGRRKQIAAIIDLFNRETTRLVTITGPGGVGKTRLAIRLASELQEGFHDGVWLIELARLTNPALIAQLAVRTFSLLEEDEKSQMQILIEYLRSRNMLLVLDNCEHLIEEAARFVQSLLRSAPTLRILATSREPLGAEGEIIWTLPPLSTPDPEAEITPEFLTQFEATDLFIERAVAVQPYFTTNLQTASAVAQVCACLDGIPLAIELAAARLKALSVEDVAARLDDRFRLLVGSRTAAARQQTLQSLIDWSYDLLSEKERSLMRRLSVFAGGWSLEAAEAVCSGGSIEKLEVLDLLAQLIDKSLVVTEVQKGVIRYQFLETIRQYAADRLKKTDEGCEYKAKHSQYYLKLSTESYPKLWGKEQGYWLDRLDIEHDNLRQALEWFSAEDPTEETFLLMAGSLWRFWEVRGYVAEGRTWMSRALKENPDASTYVRANALRGAGILARQQGDYVEAKTLHEEGLNLFRQLQPDYNNGVARQLDALGEIEQYYGNYERAITLHQESLAIQQEIGDKEGIAASLGHLGVIARDRGRFDEAENLLKQSLQLNRELEDRLRIGVDLNNLGLVATRQCQYERALSFHEEAVQQYRDLNNKLGISESLLNMGNVAKDRGDFRRSITLYDQCLAIKKELGDRRGMARATVRLATTALLQGEYRRARELADQSLDSFKVLGIPRGVVVALRISALVAVYEGDFARADRLAEESLNVAYQLEARLEAALAEIVMGLSAHAQARLTEALQYFQDSLALFREVNDRRNIAHTLVGLGRTAYRLDDHQRAQEFLDESLSLSHNFGIQWSLAYSLEIMGLLRRNRGDYDRALQMFQESLRLSSEQENRQGVANCLGAIAGLAAMASRPKQATRLFAAADRIREEIGGRMGLADKNEYETCLRLAKEQIDEATFSSSWSDGQAMSMKQAISEALSGFEF
jgi:non-specific serine/threonine protein kinase